MICKERDLMRLILTQRKAPMKLLESVRALFGKIHRRAAAQIPAAQPEIDPIREKYIRRERYLITDMVATLLPARVKFVILEGGASDSFSDTRWQAFDGHRKRLYGFEPNESECAQLNERAHSLGLDFRFFPIGLWSSNARLPLYENKSPGGNSFYPQNVSLTNRWKFENSRDKFLAADIFYPLGTTSEWNLTSVDEWARANSIRTDIDFMKLNVQGAELEILRGASNSLRHVTGIQVEMSFVESYIGRPFFADIDIFLRSHGFTFFDLIGHHCVGRKDSPITVQHAPGLYPLLGQLIEGHGVYFKDPIELHKRGRDISHFNTEKLLKLVCFAEIYHQHEFALELLYWIAKDFPAAQPLRAALLDLADRAVVELRSYAGG
jgi:FkbM family methyltransferase